MLSPACITVPGLYGSESDHWQSWAEKEIRNCNRVQGIDFSKPVIAAWAQAIRQQIQDSAGSVILLAHSFGCLASIVALADHDSKVAGVIFVAPAAPQRFSATGLIIPDDFSSLSIPNLLECIPTKPLGIPGVVIGSTNDPWMKLTHTRFWADNWGMRFVWLRNAGHINVASGFGRWQGIHQVVKGMREQISAIPLGEFDSLDNRIKQKFSVLTKVRHMTRESLHR